MKKIILFFIILVPLFSYSQQPKMNLKFIAGANSSSYIYRVEGVKSDFLPGWQVGGGARVIKRKAFVEFDGIFQNYGTSVDLFEDSVSTLDGQLDIRVRALEFPVTLGYVPIKSPFFKWFLYGGLVNKFSLNGKYSLLGEEGTFKPKELELHFYNLLARFGTQVDVAMFNFDFNYNIGVTNGIKNKVRTNTHNLQLSVGLVF
jgi:hypothetical protein